MYKKKGQITVYIIIGIIIISLTVFLFYLRNSTEEKISLPEIVKAQEIPDEIKPITTYVTTSLDAAAREGLYLIGMQGGRIYVSQGGLTPDFDAKTISYLEHEVSYGIYRQTEIKSYRYFPDPPEYPWDYFPCIFGRPRLCTDDRAQLDSGHFGEYNLPPLNGSDPSNFSIESQLIKYITNYLWDKIDLTIFNEQGFNITHGDMNVSIIIGDDDVIAFLEYPLVITKESINMEANVTYFYTNPQIRLKKIYIFVDDIINNDIVLVQFNISDPNNNGNDMTIEKIPDAEVSKHDDIIIIRDDKSMLYAKPYTFQFARENRYPALHYIFLINLFKGNVQDYITVGDIHPDTHPKAYDPDEDEFTFAYEPNLPYPVANLGPDRRFHLKVTVNDRVLEDWQDLEILVTGFTNEYD